MKKIFICLFCFSLITGCANISGRSYSEDETRQIQNVQTGTVIAVSPVNIEGSSSGLGAVTGAGLGGVLGSTIGGGWGRVAAAIGGAAIGGLAGHATEKAITKANGLEITVKLTTGQTIAIVQGNDVLFRVGDKVRILSHNGVARVSR